MTTIYLEGFRNMILFAIFRQDPFYFILLCSESHFFPKQVYYTQTEKLELNKQKDHVIIINL